MSDISVLFCAVGKLLPSVASSFFAEIATQAVILTLQYLCLIKKKNTYPEEFLISKTDPYFAIFLQTPLNFKVSKV